MMCLTFNCPLRRFVVTGCCIHHMFQDQRGLRMWPIHWGPMKSFWFRIYLITLYQCTQAIPGSDLWSGSDWIDVTSALRQICCLELVWISCWVWWFFTGNWFPIVHISRYCAGWNRELSTGIHGGADPRFPLCADETTTRGCGSSALMSHQNIMLGNNIALCSTLELFCGIQC